MENFVECWIDALNKTYIANVKVSDVNNWDISPLFPSVPKKDLFKPIDNPEFWNNVKPLDGSVEYIKRLIDDGHEVYVVTASHPNTVKPKLEKVLRVYFPYIPYKNVIIAHNKQMIKGDILIDDAPHNLIGGDYLKLLMTAQHNLGFDAIENDMIRVDSWEHAYRVISDIAERYIDRETEE